MHIVRITIKDGNSGTVGKGFDVLDGGVEAAVESRGVPVGEGAGLEVEDGLEVDGVGLVVDVGLGKGVGDGLDVGDGLLLAEL